MVFIPIHIDEAVNARLTVSTKDADKFLVGDWIEGMLVVAHGKEAGHIELSLPYELGESPGELQTFHISGDSDEN